jgi:hypothetical protein
VEVTVDKPKILACLFGVSPLLSTVSDIIKVRKLHFIKLSSVAQYDQIGLVNISQKTLNDQLQLSCDLQCFVRGISTVWLVARTVCEEAVWSYCLTPQHFVRC